MLSITKARRDRTSDEMESKRPEESGFNIQKDSLKIHLSIFILISVMLSPQGVRCTAQSRRASEQHLVLPSRNWVPPSFELHG